MGRIHHCKACYNTLHNIKTRLNVPHTCGRGKSNQKNLKEMWKRYRFKTYSISDYRPLIWNPKYPWWCSGENEETATIIAWLPKGEKLEKYWDDATDIEFTEHQSIEFSSRFPKPDSFVES